MESNSRAVGRGRGAGGRAGAGASECAERVRARVLVRMRARARAQARTQPAPAPARGRAAAAPCGASSNIAFIRPSPSRRWPLGKQQSGVAKGPRCCRPQCAFAAQLPRSEQRSGVVDNEAVVVVILNNDTVVGIALARIVVDENNFTGVALARFVVVDDLIDFIGAVQDAGSDVIFHIISISNQAFAVSSMHSSALSVIGLRSFW